jgi:hypothetical protein
MSRTEDRELLELAAKATGIDLHWQDDGSSGYYSDWRGLPQWEHWNPLADDGDALRLAVKLRLVVQHAHKYVVVMDVDRVIAEHQDTRENEGDPYAATRRAIVCAAAAMAKEST